MIDKCEYEHICQHILHIQTVFLFPFRKWKKHNITAASVHVIRAHILYRQPALNFFMLILPSQAWARVTNNKRRKEVERWKEGYMTTAQINMIQTTRERVGFLCCDDGEIETGDNRNWSLNKTARAERSWSTVKMREGGGRRTQAQSCGGMDEGQNRRQGGRKTTQSHTQQNVNTAFDGRAPHTYMYNPNVRKLIIHHALVAGWSIDHNPRK